MLHVIKAGGNVADTPELLSDFLKAFAAFPEPKILVHGGGRHTTRFAERLGLPQTLIEGRRITDADTLQVAVMSYAGWINKNIVAGLQALGCNALGLSGADANVLRAVRRPPTAHIDYGFVGDITPEEVQTGTIQQLLSATFTPVFCAITHDGQGQLLNTNADTVASVLAIALSRLLPVRLLLCFEKKGVLQNVEDDTSVIPVIHASDWVHLKAGGTIHSGMIPKLENAFQAVAQGVESVRIFHAQDLSLLAAGGEAGTLIRL
jgi:acetylglutamate kinase